MTRERLLALDAFRGIAAIIVLFHHAERELHIFPTFAFGFIAVDAFFLMSGYVITGAYEPKMDERMGLRAFLGLRLARLYPMMALGAVLGIAVALMHPVDSGPLWVAGLSSLIMIPLIWSAPVLFPVNVPQWSIFFEITVNMLHRVLAPVLTRQVLVIIIALSLVLLLVAGWQLHGLANGYSPETFWGGFPRTFLSYFAGVLIHRTEAMWKPRIPRLPLMALLATFVLLTVAETLTSKFLSTSIYWLLMVTCVLPVGLMLLIRADVPSWLARPASALGDISYPLYAIHMPLLVLAAPWFLAFDTGFRTLASVAIGGAIVFLALAVDRVIDRPARRSLARGRKRTAEAQSRIAAP